MWYKWNSAGVPAFCACDFVCFVSLAWIEQIVAVEFGPASFRVFEHLWVCFKPSHHVEEALGSFVFAFLEGCIAQVSYFIQVGDFGESLWFSDYSDAAYAFFAQVFLKFVDGFVEDVALAEADFFLGF